MSVKDKARVIEVILKDGGISKLLIEQEDHKLSELEIGSSSKELGSLEAFTDFATSSNIAESVPATTLPVRVGIKPIKITVSVSLTAVQAAALAGVVVYEDAEVIRTLHWTSPSADSYDIKSCSLRRNPSPGLHAYQVYLANFLANGNVGLFTVDPGNVGLEIIVEEI